MALEPDQRISPADTMSDNQIAAQIDALRLQFPKTRDLYREVCVLLFFRYGITPTANRLYQYVRKGSMGTPAQVLSEFWSDLRERSRVRIEHPEMPEELRHAGGELVMQLWQMAQSAAKESFSEQSKQVALELRQAREHADARDLATRALSDELNSTRTELDRSRQLQADLGLQLAVIQGRLASMTEMLRDQSDEMDELRAALDAARHEIARTAGESNALRVQLAIARSRASRKPIAGIPGKSSPDQESLQLDPEFQSLPEGPALPAPRRPSRAQKSGGTGPAKSGTGRGRKKGSAKQ
jgi:hypothetical protein